MSKIKMRCISCGKWFQSANAKEVTCPDCAQKARKEKLAAKNAPPATNTATGPGGSGAASSTRPPAPPPKPKHVQSGTNQWLDKLEDVKVAQPDQPPVRPKPPAPPVQRDTRAIPGGSRGPGFPREEREREQGLGPARGPAAYRVTGGNGLPPATGPRPRQPLESRGPGGPGAYKPAYPGATGAVRGAPRPKGKPHTPKPPVPPKPKREKIPPPPPFSPSEEQLKQVEERYIELAQPAEFDGIRTQIAHELGIPKKAVKNIIKALRSRSNIPSWWEVQTYKGSSEEFEKIKAVYEPYLPVPPVGVHKKIAEELSLKPGIVYQAIRAVRQELNLPQYNDPALHPLLSTPTSLKTSNGHKPESETETETEVEEPPITTPPLPTPAEEPPTTETPSAETAISTESPSESSSSRAE